MLVFVYFLISLFSTIAGSLTGMGGGVIIKPVLDALGQFDIESIGILSSTTVLAMSAVSILRQLAKGTQLPAGTTLSLAGGSVLGGLLGQQGLKAILRAVDAQAAVTIIQNVLLCLLILCVYLYMRNKARIPSLGKTGLPYAIAAGVFLGILSSFLGIGGGPINVALIIFVFAFDTKTATVCSLVTIFFAQISKLTTVAVSTGFSPFDLSMLAPMVIGGVIGGLVGFVLNRRCPVATVERAFNGIQFVVLGLCVLNIVRSVPAL